MSRHASVAGARVAVVGSVLAFLAGAGCSDVLGIEERTFEPAEVIAPLSCATYCTTVQGACTGDFQVYASSETCLEICAKLDLGAEGDQSGNTVGCRLGQARLAQKTGEFSEYCPRTGPGGDDVCGTNCEGYCTLMVPICGEASIGGECATVCAAVPDKGGYNVAVPYEDSIQCRLYHLTSATVDTMHCEHANGSKKCNLTGSE